QRGAPAFDPGRLRQPHVLDHRLAVHPQRPGNTAKPIAGQPPPEDLSYLDHPHLPIGHAHLLELEAAWPAQHAPGWRNVAENGWGKVSEKLSRYWGNDSEKRQSSAWRLDSVLGRSSGRSPQAALRPV